MQGAVNEDIVMAGYAGLAGSIRAAELKEQEMKARFPAAFMKRIKALSGYLTGRDAALEALGNPPGIEACECGEGGVYAALWELCRRRGLGLEVDLADIPVRQETIEICELLGLDPYRLNSSGSVLICAASGAQAAADLKKAGIYASVIGRLAAGNDKLIYNGDHAGYLNRPAPDELGKITGEEDI